MSKKLVALGAIIIAWVAVVAVVIVAFADDTASHSVETAEASPPTASTPTTVDMEAFAEAVNRSTFYDHLLRTDFYNEVNRLEAERIEAERRAATERRERQRRAEQAQPSPPSTSSAPAVADGSVWDALAQCESGGNWSMNSGNGFYGGLQFMLSTWRSVGGSGYPHEASREEQIHRAEILLARSGWGQWPACSRKLGLR